MLIRLLYSLVAAAYSLTAHACRTGIVVLIASFTASQIAAAAHVPGLVRGPYRQLSTSSSVVVRWRSEIASESHLSYGDAANALEASDIRDTQGRIPQAPLRPEFQPAQTPATTATRADSGGL